MTQLEEISDNIPITPIRLHKIKQVWTGTKDQVKKITFNEWDTFTNKPINPTLTTWTSRLVDVYLHRIENWNSNLVFPAWKEDWVFKHFLDTKEHYKSTGEQTLKLPKNPSTMYLHSSAPSFKELVKTNWLVASAIAEKILKEKWWGFALIEAKKTWHFLEFEISYFQTQLLTPNQIN